MRGTSTHARTCIKTQRQIARAESLHCFLSQHLNTQCCPPSCCTKTVVLAKLGLFFSVNSLKIYSFPSRAGRLPANCAGFTRSPFELN